MHTEREIIIGEYTKKKTKCQNKIQDFRCMRRANEKKGMAFCIQAERDAEKHGYKVAILKYQKGLPFLKKSFETIADHNLPARIHRENRYKRYKNALEFCKKQFAKNATFDISIFDCIANGKLISTVISECTNITQLYHLIPIIILSLLHIPLTFRETFTNDFFEILNEKIENHPLLEQRLRFFLYSYSLSKNQHLWHGILNIYNDHPCMPQTSTTIKYTPIINQIVSFEEDEKYENKTNYNKFSKITRFRKRSRSGASASDDSKESFDKKYFERDAIWFFRSFSSSSWIKIKKIDEGRYCNL